MMQVGVHAIRAAGGFLGGLRPFLARPLTAAESHDRLRHHLAMREAAFLLLLERAVYDRVSSPYHRLLRHARIALPAVREMLSSVGLEGTLERLHDAGVFVTLEEFKGRQPVRRGGLEFDVRADAFDNPFSARQYEARTGGSGGAAQRIVVGLDLLDHEAAYHAGFYARHGSRARRAALWLPAPPGAVGIKNVLIRAKLGLPTAHWFSQSQLRRAPWRHGAFAHATFLAAGALGTPIPRPRFTPADEVGRVARWLADERNRRMSGILLTTPSAAVRVCTVAQHLGLDISETLFVMVGEPYTASKAEFVSAAGCVGASHYAMVEAGMIGLACRSPAAPDDVHLVSDKIATVDRERSVRGGPVRALFHTTLLAASPKIMLNVESGDSGVLEQRDCGCGVLPEAFRTHLHTIRSYEKLTCEGMHFLGSELLALLEEILPKRFGGTPVDYQLVEREERGVGKVDLVVRPSVGPLEEREVVGVVLGFLESRGIGQRLMTGIWSDGGTLRVVRRDPSVTAAGKILSLQRAVS